MTDFTSPVGRLVAGSLTLGRTTNFEGKPLLDSKNQPRTEYYFALAVPKTAADASHWAHSELGKIVFMEGAAAFPPSPPNTATGYMKGDFAWKVEDGDSRVPNMKGNANADKEGHPGHWIFKFTSGSPPKLVLLDAQNKTVNAEPGQIKIGDYVQVGGNVVGNGSAAKPGVYLNHSVVCFRAPGTLISSGADPAAFGFGGAALPPGVVATGAPVGNLMPGQATATPALPGAPGAVATLPTAASLPAVQAPATLPAPAGTPVPVTPMPGAVPGAAALPMPGASPVPMPGAPAPAVAAVRMAWNAQGQGPWPVDGPGGMLEAGHKEADLLQQGYVIR